MEIIGADLVGHELLLRVREERNIVQAIKRKKADWVGHILHRRCLLKHVIGGKIEGKTEVMQRRRRRCEQLLSGRKETRGY
jgi:hypothetical protein